MDGQETESNSETKNYSFTLGHILPWNGSFSSNFNRSDINSDYLGYAFNGSIDRIAAMTGLSPTHKLQSLLRCGLHRQSERIALSGHHS